MIERIPAFRPSRPRPRISGAGLFVLLALALVVPTASAQAPGATADCTHIITASAGPGGSITPSGVVVLACGDVKQFEIAADPCFTVADVVVDGVSRGPVVSYQFLLVSEDHTIEATFARIQYPITSLAGSGGSITPTGTVNVECGSSQAYVVTPAACNGVEQLIVDGASLGALTQYTFTDVQTDHVIQATFSPLSFTIAAAADPGGAITPSGSIVVNCDGAQSFDIVADPCHAIEDVVVDGVSRGPVSSYAFTGIGADHTIQVHFTRLAYTVTATAGPGGAMTPSGGVVVPCGADLTFQIVPNACRAILDVRVDGVSKGPVGSYTFANVRQAHTIEATFVLLGFTVVTGAGPGGSIVPSGQVSVDCGAGVAIDIVPDPCYAISDVEVDGASVGAVTHYVFSNVIAGHTIFATFSPAAIILTASAAPGGGIEPNGLVALECGGGQVFTITPDPCRAIADVRVDGVSVGTVATYTFTDVRAAHTISATFAFAEDGPPVVTGLAASPAALWPADHGMREVTIDYSVTDCSPVTCALSVSSNEPATGTCDGDLAPDWEVLDAHHVRLRSERAVGGGGRVYTVSLVCTDSLGHGAVRTTPVVMAHDIASPPSGTLCVSGSTLPFLGTFWDAPGRTHQALWAFDSPSVSGTVVEPAGLVPGTSSANYTFATPGVYEVQMILTNNLGQPSYTDMGGDIRETVVAYDTTDGYAAGGGWYLSPPGVLASDPAATGKMSFAFTARFQKTPSNPRNPAGELQFEFRQGGFEFLATSIASVVISGAQVRLAGTGSITGDPGTYDYLLVMVDGMLSGSGGTDRLRLRVTAAGTGALVYDTQPGESDGTDPAIMPGSNGNVVAGYQGAAYTTDAPAGPSLPPAFALEQNTPNPARGAAWIRFAIPAPSRVRLAVYDIVGREVARLVDGDEGAGVRMARFDTARLPGGVYFCRLEARRSDGRDSPFVQTRRMLVVK